MIRSDREGWLPTPQGRVTDVEYAVALYDQALKYLSDAVGEGILARAAKRSRSGLLENRRKTE